MSGFLVVIFSALSETDSIKTKKLEDPNATIITFELQSLFFVRIYIVFRLACIERSISRSLRSYNVTILKGSIRVAERCFVHSQHVVLVCLGLQIQKLLNSINYA